MWHETIEKRISSSPTSIKGYSPDQTRAFPSGVYSSHISPRRQPCVNLSSTKFIDIFWLLYPTFTPNPWYKIVLASQLHGDVTWGMKVFSFIPTALPPKTDIFGRNLSALLSWGAEIFLHFRWKNSQKEKTPEQHLHISLRQRDFGVTVKQK